MSKGQCAYELTEATILISTVGVTQAERSHLIREELTQSFGLINDSTLYAESIFQQSWTTTQTYSPTDERLIQMLYCPAIKAGMGASEVDGVFTEQ